MHTPSSSARPVVLVVEDSSEQRLLLRDFISEICACDLYESGDTDAGLTLLQRHRPDLVLLDLHVPPRGGLVLLHALRDDPACADTHVIVLSGSRRADELAAVDAAQPCCFIEKPYNLDDLEAAIQGCLGQAVGIAG